MAVPVNAPFLASATIKMPSSTNLRNTLPPKLATAGGSAITGVGQVYPRGS